MVSNSRRIARRWLFVCLFKLIVKCVTKLVLTCETKPVHGNLTWTLVLYVVLFVT